MGLKTVEESAVFQKGKPRPALRVKTCPMCRASFQPSSGAQTFCSGECRQKGKAQGLGKPRKAREEPARAEAPAPRPGFREYFNGQPVNPEPQASKQDYPERFQVPLSTGNGHPVALPSLELDLTPLENYVQDIVARALQGMKAQPGQTCSDDDLRDLVRDIVREELSERLKSLFTQ